MYVCVKNTISLDKVFENLWNMYVCVKNKISLDKVFGLVHTELLAVALAFVEIVKNGLSPYATVEKLKES